MTPHVAYERKRDLARSIEMTIVGDSEYLVKGTFFGSMRAVGTPYDLLDPEAASQGNWTGDWGCDGIW